MPWTRGELDARLRELRVVAVLGAHSDPARPAFYVPEALFQAGVRVIPVNPTKVGHTLWGEPVRATLAELAEPVDLVDVFRRSAEVPGHLDDLLAMRPRPGGVWMQSGVRHDGVAAVLEAAGVPVVQDRCLMIEHRRAAATGW